MKKEEVWEVVRVTARGGLAHVEMGNMSHHPAFGPVIKVFIEDAPKIGDKIRLTYAWGEDYAAPVTPIQEQHPGEIDTGVTWPVQSKPPNDIPTGASWTSSTPRPDWAD